MTDEAIKRDELGRWVEGNPPGPGAPTLTPEQKAIKKATRELIADYKEKLGEALPAISPVLITKAVQGDIQAIKELHDRVMGKAPQEIDLGNIGGLPFIINIVKDDRTQGENS